MIGDIERMTLTCPEAAKLLGIGRDQAYTLAARGQLPGAHRLGRRIVVSRKALLDFLDGPTKLKDVE
jgi:excisionase family DNA binding protein